MKEIDIRPREMLDRYLDLSRQDIEICFSDAVNRQELDCVACDSNHVVMSFEKNGFGFLQCLNCHSLYQSPRPVLDTFERFYVDSISSRYWAEVFFPAVAEARREQIFKPRVDRIVDILRSKAISAASFQLVADVGAGYGLFLEEWRRCHLGSRLLAIEPSIKLAEVCRAKGFEVIESLIENVVGFDNKVDLLTCFELIEHVHNPAQFANSLCKMTKDGGYLVCTGLGCEGFDIQLLWDESKSISPPHHLNFLSVAGFENLFRRAGFRYVEVLTPGELDVDIVQNMFEMNESLRNQNRFVRTLLNRGSEAKAEFQKFLQKFNLSSHVWIICQK